MYNPLKINQVLFNLRAFLINYLLTSKGNAINEEVPRFSRKLLKNNRNLY